jgi:hypothetical protein
MVDGASVAVSILGIALRRALFRPSAEVKLDQTILDTARKRFWEITEGDFHKTLDTALPSLGDDPEGDQQEKLAHRWRGCLERAAQTIFDDSAPLDSLDELRPEHVVEGRKLLVLGLKGYGKMGADLFKALGSLDVPESKKKRISMSRAKNTVERSQ